jgi:hypothetical protein
MGVYYKHGVNLSEGQMSKISTACKKKEAISIRLSNEDLQGSFELPLTQTQINRIKKADAEDGGVQLNLSAAQLKYREKTGGFLPLIPLIAGILGGVGGLTGGIASAVSAAKSNAEQRRHNEVIEDQLKSGNGIISDVVGKVPVIGNFLQPLLQKFGLGTKDINKIMKGKCLCKDGILCKQIGNGLYLEPEGSGLFLGQRRG